jgi:hypothetical protein
MMLQLRATYPDLQLGNYYHNAGSMHIYDRHFDMAQMIIANQQAIDTSMVPMDRFDQDTVNNLIAVEQLWQECGASEDFPFDSSIHFQQLSPYWQNLVKGFFGNDGVARSKIFGQP